MVVVVAATCAASPQRAFADGWTWYGELDAAIGAVEGMDDPGEIGDLPSPLGVAVGLQVERPLSVLLRFETIGVTHDEGQGDRAIGSFGAAVRAESGGVRGAWFGDVGVYAVRAGERDGESKTGIGVSVRGGASVRLADPARLLFILAFRVQQEPADDATVWRNGAFAGVGLRFCWPRCRTATPVR